MEGIHLDRFKCCRTNQAMSCWSGTAAAIAGGAATVASYLDAKFHLSKDLSTLMNLSYAWKRCAQAGTSLSTDKLLYVLTVLSLKKRKGVSAYFLSLRQRPRGSLTSLASGRASAPTRIERHMSAPASMAITSSHWASSAVS